MAITFIKQTHRLLQQGLDLLFPPRCAGCQRGGHLLCPICIETMQPLTGPLCQHCGAPLSSSTARCEPCQQHRIALNGLRGVNLYRGPLRSAIHALKYNGQQRLAEPLGLLLAQAFGYYGLHADGIIPLPLHRLREQERGYNQATLLARISAQHLKIPCLEALVMRQRATRAQIGLNALERQRNVMGAFALASTSIEVRRYHTLVLIDDVCTTGATLEACATALYTAGIEKVWGLVLARPLAPITEGRREKKAGAPGSLLDQ